MLSIVTFLRLFCFLPERNDHHNDPIELNYTEKHQQSKLPFFIRYEKQNENGQEHKYNINYSDNPYKSSVI